MFESLFNNFYRLTKVMNPTEELKLRDYTIIIDRSGSMTTKDQKKGKKTRWEAMQETAESLARNCEEFDSDGLTVYTFASRFKRYENVTSSKIKQIFQEKTPMGDTYLDEVLQDAIDNYFQRKENKSAKQNGETFLVFTDGEPDDKQAVIKIIVDTTHRIERESEIRILLVQIGSDPEATTFLKELDNDLKKDGARYDICTQYHFDDLEDIPPLEILVGS